MDEEKKLKELSDAIQESLFKLLSYGEKIPQSSPLDNPLLLKAIKDAVALHLPTVDLMQQLKFEVGEQTEEDRRSGKCAPIYVIGPRELMERVFGTIELSPLIDISVIIEK